MSLDHYVTLGRSGLRVSPLAGMLKGAGTYMQGGATVNGEPAEPWPMSPRNDAERY
jgi:hypothetical protein